MFHSRCNSCETVLHGIEKQIQRSNTYRDTKAAQKMKFENEVCLVLTNVNMHIWDSIIRRHLRIFILGYTLTTIISCFSKRI